LSALALLLFACGGVAHAPQAAAPPGPPRGVDGRWCVSDIPAADPSFPFTDELRLSKAVWGVDAPNLVKAVTVVWDPVGGRLYGAGMATDRLVAVDPAVGHPVGAIDMEIRGNSPSILRLDPARHTLFRVEKTTGAVRVIDLVRGEVVARLEPDRAGGKERTFKFRDAAIDPATGWLWVAELGDSGLVGYSPDLKQQRTAEGITSPASVDAGPDRLVVAEAKSPTEQRIVEYRPSTNTITRETTLPSGAGRTGVTLAPDGTVLLHGAMLAAMGPDGTPLWRQPLDATASDVVVAGDTIAVLLEPGRKGRSGHGGEAGTRSRPSEGSDGGPRPRGPRGGGPRGEGPRGGGPRAEGPRADATEAPPDPADTPAEGQLLLFDLRTGSPKSTVSVGFEPTSVSADPDGRFFVGNGGDASATIVRPDGTTTTLDLGFAAERVAVDANTGDRYILDRLGGSSVYRWRPDGSVTVRSAARWPSDMAIDPKRRKGYTLGHYDALLDVWDLDTGDSVTIPLEVSANRTDTLSDLDLDVATGIAAAIFPETGGISVVDTLTREVIWSRTEARLRAGPLAGPGKGFVLVDGAADRLYVVAERTVYAYGLHDGAEHGEVEIPADTAWNVDGAWLDRVGRRLYAGSTVVKVPELTLDGTVGADVVFWADADRILGLRRAEPGIDHATLLRHPELLVELDPTTRAERTSKPLLPAGMMHLSPTYDAKNHKVYTADLSEGRVLGWTWP
jgi:DNA-binding beta-propeller fold protein YncE